MRVETESLIVQSVQNENTEYGQSEADVSGAKPNVATTSSRPGCVMPIRNLTYNQPQIKSWNLTLSKTVLKIG